MEPYARVFAKNQWQPAVLTEVMLLLFWNTDFGPHRDLLRELNIPPRQVRIYRKDLFSLIEKNVYSFTRNGCNCRPYLSKVSLWRPVFHEALNLALRAILSISIGSFSGAGRVIDRACS